MDEDKKLQKEEEELDKTQLFDDKELINKLTMPEKMSLAKQLADEIISNSEKKYKKLSDLIALTKDKKDVDVVIKSV